VSRGYIIIKQSVVKEGKNRKYRKNSKEYFGVARSKEGEANVP